MVGEIFRVRREKLNFSLRDLAERVDISYSQLSKIERGESSIPRDSFAKIAVALRLDVLDVRQIAKFLAEDYVSSYEKYKDDTVREEAAKYITNFEEKYKQKEMTLGDTILRWLVYNELGALDLPEMESLSSELQDFYEVRLRSIKNRRS
ncbi:helix-turn-helix transcriptional regulator [Paenibacillus alvei]|uniref:Helix-turn-helix transcriptional regulator n=1 Tax=Paenibacillus alvei TaxID=44250 RepID=A0ABT4EKG8_PAEAL|nr:helix-turn-helix transcriptional regulator [Paenibacillus alvei]MCY9532923.1 helix-turn-helix transcriptional regulator [Paenibacillus alvei]